MRIFTAIKHSIDPNYFYGDLWSKNFYPALQQLGIEIVESKIDLLPASRFMQIAKDFTPQEQEVRAELTQKIVEEVHKVHKKKPIDLFLSYFYNSHFDPSGFDEIHQLGILTVNFYCNSIYQFDLISKVATKASFAWHAEKHARSNYLGVGANPVWVQMGADPKVYHPVTGLTNQSKICFVGQRYADRDRWLASLIDQDLPIDIYGSGWPQADPSQLVASLSVASPTTASEYLGRKIHTLGSKASYLNLIKEHLKEQGLFGGMTRIYRQTQYRKNSRQLDPILAIAYRGYADNLSETFAKYAIVLNFSNVWADGRPGSSLIPHVRLRDFEAPISRACYLTGYTDEIAEFYDIGTEIDTYQTIDELIDKTRFYLDHPVEAEKMREAGYQRALREHTWKNRFQQLFDTMGLAS